MRQLLLAVLLAGSAQASGIISGGGPSDALSAATAAGTYVKKAGDTMTGRLTAPDATLTYGLSAATGSFSGSVTASSVTSQGDASVVGNLGIGEAASGTIGLSVKKAEVRFWNLGQHELEWGNGNIEFFEWLSGTGGGTILNNKSTPHSGGYISIPTGGAATMGLMPTSGSVGIGTASPGRLLDVNGAGVVRGNFDVAGGTVSIRGDSSGNIISMKSNLASANSMRVQSDSSAVYIDNEQPGSIFLRTNGSVNKMAILNSGNIGIGVDAPASKLHMSSGTLTVDGNQSGDVLTVRSNLSNADLHFLLETTGTGGSESSRIDLKTTNRHWLIQNAKGLSNGFAIRDETAGSATRLFIDDGGRVGVGTTSLEAANKIQVQAATGNVVVASSTTASGFGVFSAHGTAGGCIMLTDTDNAGWTKCKALNGTLTCAIDADGICD